MCRFEKNAAQPKKWFRRIFCESPNKPTCLYHTLVHVMQHYRSTKTQAHSNAGVGGALIEAGGRP